MNKPVQQFLLLIVSMTLSAYALADSNKWRLKVNGGSDSDGVIIFEIEPKGGEKYQVEVEIAEGKRENRVANSIEEQLKDKIGDDYNVERDDFEDVLIKKKLGDSNFDFRIVENTVEGVELKLKKE